MVVDTAEIDRVFSAMMVSSQESLDVFYDDDKIDAEIYSKVVASLIAATMKLAATAVQQQPTIDAQVQKMQADIAFVQKQTLELGRSVDFNNEIKALQSLGDTIGTVGAGGLIPSTDIWTTFFDRLQALSPTSNGVPNAPSVTLAK